MKIDLIYPKIPDSNTGLLNKCIAFEKLDGSNMHWVWTLVDGWTHFGTRRTQFNLNRDGVQEFRWQHGELHAAPDLFNERLRDRLTTYLCQTPYRFHTVTIFTEFHGPNSFAGNHDFHDGVNNTQTLTLIDVAMGKKIIPPEQFINDFEFFGIPKVVYTGKHIGQLVEDVHKGKYDVKRYKAGDYESSHYHKIATEITLIVSGQVEMNGIYYDEDDIIVIEPNDRTDFKCLTDVVTVVVKYPGANDDKYVD